MQKVHLYRGPALEQNLNKEYLVPRISLKLNEAVSFAPLEDGDYPVDVTEFSEVKQGAKASYIAVTLEVEEGHENAGAKLWTNLMVDGKAAGMFVDFINRCKGTDYDVADLDDLDIDTDELIGSELTAIVKQEEYPEGSGEMRAQCKSLLARM